MGTSGKLVGEQQLAAYLVRRIAETLAQQGKLKVLTLSADEYAPKLKGKLFLAIHADGSEKPCSTGPSLSYQKNNSTLAMHAVGWALSQALGYQYDQFRKDGFTADAAHYYMFGHVDAPVMKGLLEVGELTCAEMEQRLVAGADAIASNVAKALMFVHEAHAGATAAATR
ncbi:MULTISPECIES: N-acetylmuramoyl-L-alanine amidase [unclassified Massilia]|uniref:N-acetylmuramoyl-L-alanine amidase n=1 Tax=unclassified Massilia TaxID=2609279 RepID=UPI001E303345|nr:MULTISPECIES: N-acetylmuramoyl-L-alanine amidase [unclassified Massilia]